MKQITWPRLGVACALLLCALYALQKVTPACADSAPAGAAPVKLTLDWKPEPEFGGFYAALQNGDFTKNGLDVSIKPAGEGADTWQLVATGKTDFATTTADQVLIARRSGADVVAIFTVYQTFPQGIMVHKARGFTSIKDVFTHEGSLLAEGNAWLSYLQKKFGQGPLKISGYQGGISEFLAKPDCSQQCFVTSEPILAKRQGSDPQTFLIADEGYNPYTTVVICKGELWKTNPDRVKAMVAACRQGWRSYLDQPEPTNTAMHELNPDMDLQTFGEAAQAQKPLIETDQTKASGLGTMTAQRWTQLSSQLQDLGVLDQPINAAECFVNP
jgi:NitT/TauT family transport system substrate-binding protein